MRQWGQHSSGGGAVLLGSGMHDGDEQQPARVNQNMPLSLARHAEALGYRRFWLAEHHNIAGIASAATAVLIGYVAGGTETIRVGAGGVMLPNHAPLIIAEQFVTLETHEPGRLLRPLSPNF
jgi:luciferase family oxidoreductase group 1